MRYSKLVELGERLRRSNIEYISTEELKALLRRATDVYREETLRRYIKLLRDEGFIRFADGVWEVVRK